MTEDVFRWFITRLLKTLNTVWNSELAGGARCPAYGTGTMAKAGIKRTDSECDSDPPAPPRTKKC